MIRSHKREVSGLRGSLRFDDGGATKIHLSFINSHMYNKQKFNLCVIFGVCRKIGLIFLCKSLMSVIVSSLPFLAFFALSLSFSLFQGSLFDCSSLLLNLHLISILIKNYVCVSCLAYIFLSLIYFQMGICFGLISLSAFSSVVKKNQFLVVYIAVFVVVVISGIVIS